jgi:uncharacterized small protein (DUF1192 family)
MRARPGCGRMSHSRRAVADTDQMEINDRIATLNREIAQLQTRRQEAHRIGDNDLDVLLQTRIGHLMERVNELAAERDRK